MLEITASLILSLLISYTGLAYRYSFPSPFESRHEKTLKNISVLESQLWPEPAKASYGRILTVMDHYYTTPAVNLTTIQPTPYKQPVERPIPNGRPDQQMPRTDTKGTA